MGASCCGEAKDLPGGMANTQAPLLTGGTVTTITSQPATHPMPNMIPNGVFQPPSILLPPPVHGNLQQQSTNAWSHSPQMTEFGTSTLSQTTAIPTYNGTTYNGSHFDVANGFSSIPRPPSAHSPNLSPPKPKPAIQDEGKMSISIDFGMYQHIISLQTLILVQVQRFLVW